MTRRRPLSPFPSSRLGRRPPTPAPPPDPAAKPTKALEEGQKEPDDNKKNPIRAWWVRD